MNRDIVSAAGAISVPNFVDDSVIVNSLVIGDEGDLYLLGNEGKLYISSITNSNLSNNFESSTKNLFQEIHLDLVGDDIFKWKTTAENLELNSTSSLLLTWSAVGAAVLMLNRDSLSFENSPSGKIFWIAEDIFNDLAGNLVQARWHPLSGQHIILLFRTGPLVMVDAITGNITEYPLELVDQWKSFTFGNDNEWLKLSIILVTESADIYVLCPIVPTGSILSKSLMTDIYDWLDEFSTSEDGPLAMASSHYISVVKQYMKATFIEPKHTNESIFDTSYRVDYSAVSSPEPLTSHRAITRLPLLQGPLNFHNKQNKHNKNENPASDIMLLSAATSPVPVICVAHNNGDVRIYIINGTLGPSWQSDSGIENDLSILPPQLVEVELIRPFTVTSTSTSNSSNETNHQDEQRSSTSSTMGSKHQSRTILLQDPALAYCFYICTNSPANITSISVKWFANLITEILQTEKNSSTPTTTTTTTTKNNTNFQSSSIIPLFCPSNVFAEVEATGNTNTKTTPTSTSTTESQYGPRIIGFTLTNSVMFGRLALIRTSSGLVVEVNLSVFERLHSLQMKMQEEANETSSSLPVDMSDFSGTSALRMISKQLIEKVEKGLMNVPKPSTEGFEREESAERITELLKKTSSHLENEVIEPMKELHKRTCMRSEIIKDVYASQASIISGNEEFTGLKSRIETAMERNASLTARIVRIKERLEISKEMSAACLSTAHTTQLQCTKAERQYARQLEDWQVVVSRLEANINAQKREAKRALSASSSAPLSPHPSPSSLRHQLLGNTATSSSSFGFGAGSPVHRSEGYYMTLSSPMRQSSLLYSTPRGSSGKPRYKVDSPWSAGAGEGSQVASPSPLQLTDDDVALCFQKLKEQNDLILRTRTLVVETEDNLKQLQLEI